METSLPALDLPNKYVKLSKSCPTIIHINTNKNVKDKDQPMTSIPDLGWLHYTRDEVKHCWIETLPHIVA